MYDQPLLTNTIYTIIFGHPIYLCNTKISLKIGIFCNDCENYYDICKCEYCEEYEFNTCLCDLNIKYKENYSTKERNIIRNKILNYISYYSKNQIIEVIDSFLLKFILKIMKFLNQMKK